MKAMVIPQILLKKCQRLNPSDTLREVIGILRNRPMFRHAQPKERRGGIRWRLDVLSLAIFDSKGL